jgi:hypothetical protein
LEKRLLTGILGKALQMITLDIFQFSTVNRDAFSSHDRKCRIPAGLIQLKKKPIHELYYITKKAYETKFHFNSTLV